MQTSGSPSPAAPADGFYDPGPVKELAQKWEAWAKRCGVLPYPEKVASGKKKGKGKEPEQGND